MGDRASVSFINDGKESVTLFSHWGGMEFVEIAKDYVKLLDKNVPKARMYPLQRREPNTVMLDFIRWYFANNSDEPVMSSYYLGATDKDGDNSDNGHHRIQL